MHTGTDLFELRVGAVIGKGELFREMLFLPGSPSMQGAFMNLRLLR